MCDCLPINNTVLIKYCIIECYREYSIIDAKWGQYFRHTVVSKIIGRGSNGQYMIESILLYGASYTTTTTTLFLQHQLSVSLSLVPYILFDNKPV